MLKRDFIMVQIEELGKAIARLVFNRQSGKDGQNPEIVRDIYHSLKVDPAFLLSGAPDEIRSFLDQDDGCGLARMELAAKTLLEESYLRPDSSPALRRKAKELLTYIQQNDNTFSLERVALLEELETSADGKRPEDTV